MPTGPRVRANNVYGTVSDNPLLVGGVSFTSLGLSLLPPISGQHAVIVLDPKRVFGEPEIVVVTSHSAMGTTATITRAQYGTVARQHAQGTAWAHVPVDEDFTEILTSGTLPGNPYAGQEVFQTDLDKVVVRNAANTAWVDTTPLGQWASWTPTFTNLTIGAGSSHFRYHKVGRMVNFKFRVDLGAGLALADPPRFTLPFAPAADYVIEYPISGYVTYLDVGVRAYVGGVQIFNTTDVFLRWMASDLTPAAWSNVSATSPFTWVAGDKIMGHGIYEAVS